MRLRLAQERKPSVTIVKLSTRAALARWPRFITQEDLKSVNMLRIVVSRNADLHKRKACWMNLVVLHLTSHVRESLYKALGSPVLTLDT